MTIAAGTATAFPEHYYSQDELLLTLKREWGDRLPDVALLERLHRRLRVEGPAASRPTRSATWRGRSTACSIASRAR